MAAIDFPASPTNGQVYAGWVYDSSLPGWRNVNSPTGASAITSMGLKNVVPTSVTVGSGSATINANGFVTFTGASSISLNGVFSSTYTNYMVNLVETSASVQDATIWGRLRNAGTDLATSYYEGGTLQSGATLTAINNLNISQWDMGKTHSATEPNAHASLRCAFFQPYLPRPTTFYTESTSWNGSLMISYRFSGFNTALTSYDSISFIPSSGTYGGTVQIFGYTN